MAVLGIDFGLKRIGLAFSDAGNTIAFPGPAITGTEEERIAAIVREAESRAATEIVVGLPRHMNGGESDMSARAAEFAEKLGRAATATVIAWDERLTSVQAERAMLSGDLTRAKRKKRIDSLAAQLMLQSYLDSRHKPQLPGTMEDDNEA